METTNIPWPVIAQKLAALGKKPAWLAIQLRTGTNTITNWKNRGGAPLSRAREIADALQCTTDDLLMPVMPDAEHIPASADISKKSHLSGMIEGSHLPVGATLTGQELPNPTPDKYVLVPQLDIVAACGEGRLNDHVIVEGRRSFAKSDLREWGVPERAARLIHAAGGSMRPTIQDGRAVLINIEDKTPVEGKIYAVCMPHDGLVLKRLAFDYHPATGSMVWILRSDNPDKTQFPDKMLPPDDRTMIVGKAIWTDSLL